MPITSGQIAQSFSAQQAMFGGQMAYAQQLSYPMQAALSPGMPPPPPPSAAAGFMNAQPAGFGMAGEQVAASGMSTAAMAGGIGLTGMQTYGMFGGRGMMGAAGRALDPFTYLGGGFRAGSAMGGRMGMGMLGRGALGAAGAGAAALPIYAAYKAAEVYGDAFQGGMRDQTQLNQTLRSNFQHFGGGGAFGRGFSQGQMGQIGMDVAQTVRNDPYMSMGEATSLIGQGAQGGMFTGVQGASEFTQKFRQMLDTLKGVQRELGGSLNDAMQFVNEARQSGVFQTADRLRLAAGQRTTSAVTGLNSMQQAQMTQFGAQLSRSIGGRSAQGAFGAQRAMQQVGAAVQTGALNQEQIFEMTGQTGAAGQMAYAQQMMQQTARFTRRAHGRYSIFGLSNREGTGLDATQLARFSSGDIGVGELSRRAHRNVGRMGRARAINQEGRLRGAALEQGGIGFQIGAMRQMVGDRVLQQDDDLASLVLQRRFHMERPQAEAMMSLMRNQGAISRREQIGRIGSARQMSSQRQLEERGLDATMDQLGQTMSNRLGVTATREMGQRTMTRISSLIEKAMNDMLGIVDHQMTSGTAAAMGQASIGRATQGQMRRIESLSRASGRMGGTEGVTGGDPFGRGLLEMPSFMGGGRTQGEALEAFGFNVSGYGGFQGAQSLATTGDFGAMISGTTGVRDRLRRERGTAMTPAQVQAASVRVSMAMQGQVTGGARERMAAMAGDPGTSRRLNRASLLAFGQRQRGGLEGTTLFEMMEGGGGGTDDRLAMTALMARQGTLEREGLTDPSGMRGGEGSITAGMIGRDALRLAASFTGLGGLAGPLSGGSEVMAALQGSGPPGSVGNRNQRAISYVARGGGLARGATGREREALAGAHGAIGREAFESAYQDETIGGMVDEITAASERGDTMAVQRGIQNLERHGQTLEGTQGRAVQSIALQMQQERDRFNGRVGGHHRSARVSREDVLAFRQESQAAGRAAQRISVGIQGDTRMAQRLREGFQRVGERQMTVGAESRGFQIQAGMIENIAMMGREDAGEAMALIGGAEIQGTGPEAERARAQRGALVGEISRRQALQRDLTGGGRRGQRQAQETALNMITGGTIGRMEFTDARGRRLSGRRAQHAITQALQAGEGATEEQQQLRTRLIQQMQEAGISGAQGLVQNLQTALSTQEDNEGVGRISRNEASRLREAAREQGGDIGRAQQEALRQAQARQNPLDATRNQTLTEILQAIRNQGNGDGGGGGTTEEGGRGESQ